MSWDSQRKATSEGLRGPVPGRGAEFAIGGYGLWGWGELVGCLDINTTVGRRVVSGDSPRLGLPGLHRRNGKRYVFSGCDWIASVDAGKVI